jgi:microcystin-dependent protein
MSTPFLGEVKLVGFGFAPRGWALCDGQIMPINQNQTLFALLGTTYGGNGSTTFGLPDLRGRTPIHMGEGFKTGQKGGAEGVALDVATMPAHPHPAMGTTAAGTQPLPADAVLAATNNLYRQPTTLTPLHPGTVGNTGGGQAHNNMQPFLTLNFAIATSGIFPSRN